jgi:serine/threonine-protein kinase RsbW
MSVGYVARSTGPQHDSATRRLDEAQGRQRRLVDHLAPTREQASAQERLSAGRAGVASRDQWLHWIEEAESLEPWADGNWAPTPTLTAEGGRPGLLAITQHPGALVELVFGPQGDGSATSRASWIAPALPACVGPVRRRLVDFVAAHRDDERLLGDVRLAVSEAITNAVVHAYRDRDQPGTVTAGIGTAAGRIEVIVSDGGVGMSPRPDSLGAGLGLSLMSAACDQVTIGPGPTGKGTEVRMIFALR